MVESGYQHEFDHYLAAFTASSDRVRYILIVIVLSSIFVFTGVWNSNQKGWALSRLRCTRLALQYELWNGLPKSIDALPAGKRAHILEAKDFVDRRDLHSREVVEKLNEALQAHVINHVASIQIPFLGVTIDVNDLGIIGGFGFVVIMMWLAFSLKRLRSNMEVSLARFNSIEQHVDRLFVYNTFVMSQVLNIPPSMVKPVFSRSRFLPRSLYLLPLVVHTYVTAYDFVTMDRARSTSVALSAVLQSCESLWLIMIGTLAIVCLREFWYIDGLWQSAFNRLRDLQPAEAPPIVEPAVARPSGVASG